MEATIKEILESKGELIPMKRLYTKRSEYWSRSKEERFPESRTKNMGNPEWKRNRRKGRVRGTKNKASLLKGL